MGFTEDGIIFNHECYDGYEPEDFAALFMKAVEQDVRFVDYCHKVVNEIEKKRKAREEKRKRKNGS